MNLAKAVVFLNALFKSGRCSISVAAAFQRDEPASLMDQLSPEVIEELESVEVPEDSFLIMEDDSEVPSVLGVYIENGLLIIHAPDSTSEVPLEDISSVEMQKVEDGHVLIFWMCTGLLMIMWQTKNEEEQSITKMKDWLDKNRDSDATWFSFP